MSIKIGVPEKSATQLKPRISVIGVGGAGGNAVNNMIQAQLEGVDFIVANTDAQALLTAQTDIKIQLGTETTRGLGAGANPEVGKAAAEETIEEVMGHLDGANMVFITAGMGGGTGTGAAPVIARTARERGILTVGVVTKPFQFEGKHRMELACAGIEELSRSVDTLIIIPNQNLFRVANEKTTFADAFKMADDVLYAGVRSVTDLMIMPGLINLDFADVRAVMSEMGKAMMGSGEADGERRALDAAELAIANPLLDDTSMAGARGVLINITGGNDLTLFEVDEAANKIRDQVDTDANIIFGSCFDENLDGKIRVSVVATGIRADEAVVQKPQPMRQQEVRYTEPLKPAVVTEAATEQKKSIMDNPTWAAPLHQSAQAPIPAGPETPPLSPAQKAVETAAAAPVINDESVIPSMPPAEQFFGQVLDDTASQVEEPAPAEPQFSPQVVQDTPPVPQPQQAEAFIPAPAHTPEDDLPPKEEIAPAAEGDQPRSPTLFERVTGLSIVRPEQEEQRSASEAPRPSSSGTPSESELEIPAFLRRHN